MLPPVSFETAAANTLEEGLAVLDRFRPDVIILDLLMPEADGLSSFREIRRHSNSPVLILSALGNPGIHVQVLEEGADDFLMKPVSRQVLIAHIKNLAWRSQVEGKASELSMPFS